MRLPLPADLASRAALYSVLLSAVLMVLKISVGLISGSAAVLSDGIDSLEDIMAASIVLVGVRYGARPADAGHPFGHGRAETIAATLQSLFIASGGLIILYTAAGRFTNPPESIDTTLAIGVMLGAAFANLALVRYTSSVAKRTGSPAIASEARHLWTNVVQAVAVVAALVLVAVTGEVIFDGLIAVFLGLYLLYTASRILWGAAADVLDSSLGEEEIALIDEAIRAEGDRVESFHQLRTRRSGQVRHIDFHLVLPGDMTVTEAHEIMDRIEDRIRRHWPESLISVHGEPHDYECEAASETLS